MIEEYHKSLWTYITTIGEGNGSPRGCKESDMTEQLHFHFHYDHGNKYFGAILRLCKYFLSTLSFDHYIICSSDYYSILMVIFYLPCTFYIYYLEYFCKEDMSLLYSYQCVFVCMPGCSIVSDSVTLWTVAGRAPLFMG